MPGKFHDGQHKSKMPLENDETRHHNDMESEKEPLLATHRGGRKVEQDRPAGWFRRCATGVTQLLIMLIVIFAIGVIVCRLWYRGQKVEERGHDLLRDLSQTKQAKQLEHEAAHNSRPTPERPSQAPPEVRASSSPKHARLSQAPPEVSPFFSQQQSETPSHQPQQTGPEPILVQSGNLQAKVNVHHKPSWHSLRNAEWKGSDGHLNVHGNPLFALFTDSGRISSTDCTSSSITQGGTSSLRIRLSCPHGLEAAFEIRAPAKGAEGYLRLGVEIWAAESTNSFRHGHWPSEGFRKITLFDVHDPSDVRLTGPAELSGLPLTVADRFFLGGEHPLAFSKAVVNDTLITSAQEKHASRVFIEVQHLHTMTKPLVEKPWRFGAVVGIIPESSQARRAFVNYLHHERPGRRMPMVHYNSWFDFYSWQDEGFFGERANRTDVMDESSCIGRVKQFGEHLVKERGVKVDSFLFDDGWDDTKTLWEFDHARFPNGFKEVAKTAQRYGSGVGVWLSPWGGYGDAQDKRVSQGRRQGFETTADGGFDLMGPKYSAWFLKVIQYMRRNEGVNLFKFDGVSTNAGEMEAMLGMIEKARTTGVAQSQKPAAKEKEETEDEIWINLTTGTWASPFFLLWADSIWRGDGDVGPYPNQELADGLSQRQKWIRWRAQKVQEHIVSNSEFFPLSQLMIHGVVLANHGDALYARLGPTAEAHEFAQEVWSFLGLGLQLQEMYISAQHMTAENWDTLAEGLRWSRAHAHVLLDAHWAFGQVFLHEVFCVASWNSQEGRGFVLLQNTQAEEQSSQVFTLAGVLQLPNKQLNAELHVKVVKALPGAVFTSDSGGSSPYRLQGCQAVDRRECLISASASTSISLRHTEVLILEVFLAQ